jgi:hypothetical protein
VTAGFSRGLVIDVRCDWLGVEPVLSGQISFCLLSS